MTAKQAPSNLLPWIVRLRPEQRLIAAMVVGILAASCRSPRTNHHSTTDCVELRRLNLLDFGREGNGSCRCEHDASTGADTRPTRIH